jgi:hypothetical protein
MPYGVRTYHDSVDDLVHKTTGSDDDNDDDGSVVEP